MVFGQFIADCKVNIAYCKQLYYVYILCNIQVCLTTASIERLLLTRIIQAIKCMLNMYDIEHHM